VFIEVVSDDTRVFLGDKRAFINGMGVFIEAFGKGKTTKLTNKHEEIR
jgi:hypothetical protein